MPGRVLLLDQTRLPLETKVVPIESAEEMADAIRRLAVRGAPAIGIAAAFGVVLGVQRAPREDGPSAAREAERVARELAKTRPTAVALSRALERMRARGAQAARAGADGEGVARALLAEARAMLEEDREVSRGIARWGAGLLRDGDSVLTHCNAGSLATTSTGTALAIVYRAVEEGKRVRVYATETRPLLQGARLTAFELLRSGVEVVLLVDSAAGSLLRSKRISAVLVGADRIARNGDVANKIGTYPLSLLAGENGVPFYVAAPLDTFDPTFADGGELPIEERPEGEVVEFAGRRTASEGVKVFNPAFDVTPARFVTGFVTEAGLLPAPDEAKVTDLLRRTGRARGT